MKRHVASAQIDLELDHECVDCGAVSAVIAQGKGSHSPIGRGKWTALLGSVGLVYFLLRFAWKLRASATRIRLVER